MEKAVRAQTMLIKYAQAELQGREENKSSLLAYLAMNESDRGSMQD